eukprot:TRINITY_DN684_c0_g1_i1.p1 TRINITY_DN684_c0_g1~~TRINITY_DN684_c0_g1_i1.p1  ORF type:complete len:408 (+),score=105.85 TRINITY_DN684_c0_g1_i1:33-1256(+)
MSFFDKIPEWQDDNAMGVLMSDFRENEAVDPHLWNYLKNFWKTTILKYLQHENRFMIHGIEELEMIFQRNNVIPICFSKLVDLLHEDKILIDEKTLLKRKGLFFNVGRAIVWPIKLPFRIIFRKEFHSTNIIIYKTQYELLRNKVLDAINKAFPTITFEELMSFTGIPSDELTFILHILFREISPLHVHKEDGKIIGLSKHFDVEQMKVFFDLQRQMKHIQHVINQQKAVIKVAVTKPKTKAEKTRAKKNVLPILNNLKKNEKLFSNLQFIYFQIIGNKNINDAAECLKNSTEVLKNSIEIDHDMMDNLIEALEDADEFEQLINTPLQNHMASHGFDEDALERELHLLDSMDSTNGDRELVSSVVRPSKQLVIENEEEIEEEVHDETKSRLQQDKMVLEAEKLLEML